MRKPGKRSTDGTTSVTINVTLTALVYKYLFSKAEHGCHHQWHHPFLFIL